MKRVSGVTIVELIIVLFVLSVLMGYGMPWAARCIDELRWKSAVSDAYVAVLTARSRALEGGVATTICPMASDLLCGGSWEGRWLLFLDRNQNGNVDGTDEVLRVFDDMRISGGVSWRSFRNLSYMQFSRDGLAYDSNGTLLFCDREGRPGWDRKLIISRSGRPRIEVAPATGGLSDCSGRRSG